jgi:phycocyanin-associated rod protein
MLGQSALVGGRAGEGASRVFIYEVEGLHQNDQTALQRYQVRQSGTVRIKVPYARMNEEMQRLNRIGARIVAIHSAAADE